MADLSTIGEWSRWLGIILALVLLMVVRGAGYKTLAVPVLLVAAAKFLFLSYLNFMFGE